MKRNKLYVGIDPGVKGGVVAKTRSKIILLEEMPTSETDIWQLFEGLAYEYENIMAVIEKVNSHKMGRKSAQTFFCNYQALRQSMIGNYIPFQEATPQSWMKSLGIPTNSKLSDKDKKEKLRSKSQQLFPKLNTWKCTLTHQRKVCDALLITHYCELTYR